MKIVSLQVNAIQQTLFGDNHKIFTFTPGVNVIFSKKNSVGKTTLLRMLMYALGYQIPSIRGIRFSDYETILAVIDAGENEYILTRNRNYIVILHDGKENRYSLPIDQSKMHALIFGLDKFEVVDNLLGTFYVDQEKGWTLLNRGKVIGNIHFSIEALLRGLSNKSNGELAQRLSIVKQELKKYRYMLDIAKYKAEINKLGETIYFDSPADEIDTALDVLYCERKPLEEELRRIKNVIRKNSSFEKYIASFRLRVKTPDGNEIPVNKDTLVGYSDMSHLLIAKQKIISDQLAMIDKKIHQLKAKQTKDETLFEVKSRLEKFDIEISKIDVDAFTTQKIITMLEKERKSLEEQIITGVKQNNPLVVELHGLISQYATRLGLDEKYVSARNDYIFTNNLKSLSGAIFHKIVFAFKISYVTLIRNHTGLCLPIILDSPSGREVSEENVNEMMAILAEDYAEHQIIIASIYNSYNFKEKTIIELQDRLLPF